MTMPAVSLDCLLRVSNYPKFYQAAGRGQAMGRTPIDKEIWPSHIGHMFFNVNKFVNFFKFLSVILAYLQVSLATGQHAEKFPSPSFTYQVSKLQAFLEGHEIRNKKPAKRQSPMQQPPQLPVPYTSSSFRGISIAWLGLPNNP